jgi:hypothetical protein
VYLDQMAVSDIAKSLDPDRDQDDPRLQFWREAYGILDRLVKLNLVVCPMSRIHEKESYVHSLGSEIELVAEQLARDVSFKFPEEVHLLQLYQAYQGLGNSDFDYSVIPRGAVLDGDLREWYKPIRIKANFPTFFHPPEHTKAVRDRAHRALQEIWERWRANPASFEERFQFELAAGAAVLVEQYVDHLKRQKGYMEGGGDLFDEVVNPPLLATIVPRLAQWIAGSRTPGRDPLATALEFLGSDLAARAPYNWNSALLIAALARKAGAGQRKIGRGTLNDVIALSTVAPYCDAIFMDDAMAGLLNENPLSRDFGTSAQHFSNRRRKEFLAFLSGIEETADREHLALVEALYRPTQLAPYFEIVAVHRKREAGRKSQ